MKRVLLAIGCDTYHHMPSLRGAERDALDLSDQLVSPAGDYSAASSLTLRSPSLNELRAAFSALPFGGEPTETLTFYFAGHGGARSGTYYLCVRDTDAARLSTSALPLASLLSVVSELRPLQVNLIIDACQSGSAMLDSATLLRAEALGFEASTSFSIAFLAACSPSEYAYETPGGGLLTQRLLKYVRGDDVLQTTRPFLDLIDLGRRVSAELQISTRDQVPITWGINLTGEGRFARNPRVSNAVELHDLAVALRSFPIESLDREEQDVLRKHSFSLWSEHRKLEAEPDLASLLHSLQVLATDLGQREGIVAQVLRGLATSLRASAAQSTDIFAEALVLYACTTPLLAHLNAPDVKQLVEQLLAEASQVQGQIRRWMLDRLKSDHFALLSEGNGVADLYYLPLRLSRILGWVAVDLEVNWLMGRSETGAIEEVEQIARLLLEQYASSLVAVSDVQAPWLLVFLEAARRNGWAELREQILGCYFGSFVESSGVIARPDLSPGDAFHFLLGKSQGSSNVEYRFRANPTQLLATLLICGADAGLNPEWDPDLRRLDHQSGYVFIPDTYQSFADTLIERGRNFNFEIGNGTWTLADLRDIWWETLVRPAVREATRDLSPIGAALAIIASCLMPDRLPLGLLAGGETTPS